MVYYVFFFFFAALPVVTCGCYSYPIVYVVVVAVVILFVSPVNLRCISLVMLYCSGYVVFLLLCRVSSLVASSSLMP